MASGSNDTPLDREQKSDEQSAHNEQGHAADEEKNSSVFVDSSQCNQHQDQTPKPAKKSWSTWLLSHRWVIGLIIAGIVLIYYGAAYYRIGKFILKEGLGGDEKASTNNETQVQMIPATTSVEVQQPYTTGRDASREITRARHLEKTRSRSRNKEERGTQQQIRENNEETCGEPGKADTCYASGITCYSGFGSSADIYYCRDGLNPPDTKNTPHGGVENPFECKGFSEDDYVPPSAYTVTATSSTQAFRVPKLGDPSRSNGPIGIRPGFGFSSIPILEEITLGAAVVVAWIAAWRYV
ncbi:hypothetical protein F5Y07DRAFT_396782 [Xylaria sp. FL0933]|nr:hypothetical protein F5Y07DRAFT_396782 [Xylaria sp. FL0933]